MVGVAVNDRAYNLEPFTQSPFREEIQAVKIAVASKNPVKIAACREAFSALAETRSVNCVGVSVVSGVADQPMSDQETRLGARNRVMAALDAVPDVDFAVGLEGGVERIEDRLFGFAWAAVTDRTADPVLVRSVGLPLPDAVRQLVDQGLELGEANDRVFSTLNSKQGGGAFGLLTKGRYTRESVYTETVVMALLPYLNPVYAR